MIPAPAVPELLARVLVEQDVDREALSRLQARRTRVYLAGPHEGAEQTFEEVGSWLRELGFPVTSQHEVSQLFGDDRSVLAAAHTENLLDSDLVILVGCWADDDGVEADLQIAQAVGIPWICYEARLSRLHRTSAPPPPV